MAAEQDPKWAQDRCELGKTEMYKHPPKDQVDATRDDVGELLGEPATAERVIDGQRWRIVEPADGDRFEVVERAMPGPAAATPHMEHVVGMDEDTPELNDDMLMDGSTLLIRTMAIHMPWSLPLYLLERI